MTHVSNVNIFYRMRQLLSRRCYLHLRVPSVHEWVVHAWPPVCWSAAAAVHAAPELLSSSQYCSTVVSIQMGTALDKMAASLSLSAKDGEHLSVFCHLCIR